MNDRNALNRINDALTKIAGDGYREVSGKVVRPVHDRMADALEYIAENGSSSPVVDAIRVKGSVLSYANLPATGMEVGDMYNIETADPSHGINAGDNVVWTGETWDNFGGLVDLSGKLDKNLGSENEGKFLSIDASGNIIVVTGSAILS